MSISFVNQALQKPLHRLDMSAEKSLGVNRIATLMALVTLAFLGTFLVRETDIARVISQMFFFRNPNKAQVIGHRGTRGLMPENTIPAFIYGITIGAEVIEMDVYVTKDGDVVVTHDPSLNYEFCTGPNGEVIPNSAYSLKHFLMKDMNMSEIERCDCGRKNPHFATQTFFPIGPPRLTEMFDAIETFVKNNNKTVNYLIEIKTRPDWDGPVTPDVKIVAQKVYDIIKAKNMIEKSIVQSFDNRPLQHIRSVDPNIRLGMLTGNDGVDAKKMIEGLGFTPYSYGPVFTIIDPNMIAYCHSIGVRVFGWSVNEFADMEKLLAMGIDGLITDYPDRARRVVH